MQADRLAADLIAKRPTTNHESKSKKTPDPELFSGDRADPERFISDYRLKARSNEDWWSLEDKKITHFYLLLTGTAKDTIRNYISDDGSFTFTTL